MLFVNVLKIMAFGPLLLVLDAGDLPDGTQATPRAPNLEVQTQPSLRRGLLLRLLCKSAQRQFGEYLIQGCRPSLESQTSICLVKELTWSFYLKTKSKTNKKRCTEGKSALSQIIMEHEKNNDSGTHGNALGFILTLQLVLVVPGVSLAE